MMNIVVNGKDIDTTESITLLSFLESQEMKPDQVVAAINDDIIEREQYSSVILQSNDKLDLMSFVGGG